MFEVTHVAAGHFGLFDVGDFVDPVWEFFDDAVSASSDEGGAGDFLGVDSDDVFAEDDGFAAFVFGVGFEADLSIVECFEASESPGFEDIFGDVFVDGLEAFEGDFDALIDFGFFGGFLLGGDPASDAFGGLLGFVFDAEAFKDDEFFDLLGVCSGVEQSDKAAHAVAHENHVFGVEFVDEVGDIKEVGGEVISSVGDMVGVAVASSIEENEGVFLGECGDEGAEGAAVIEEAVDADDGCFGEFLGKYLVVYVEVEAVEVSGLAGHGAPLGRMKSEEFRGLTFLTRGERAEK